MSSILAKEEFQGIMISILKSIDAFCNSRGLRYYLAWGTLLGAVRHQGFIPWDDDIDIWMPRSDYDVFLKEFKNEHYKVLCSANTKDFPLDFAKLQDNRTIVHEEGGDGNWGVFVDIFPLDDVPSREQGLKVFRKVRLLRRFAANQRFTRHFKLKKSNGLSKNINIIIGRLMSPFMSLNKILLAEDKAMKKYCNINFPLYADLCDIGTPLMFEKSLFEEVEMLLFEGERFRAPKEYDKVLTQIFGNYMELPPVEKRVSNHGIKAYWKE